MRDSAAADLPDSHVAITGLACRFPGAPTPDRFWENLRAGRESITFFSDDELRAAGVQPALVADPSYVKASGILADIESFDAGFFGFTPREAAILDVQQRLFLECAWEALESAGFNPDDSDQICGVFAGSGPNTYLLSNLIHDHELISALGGYQLMLSNDKDYLSTRVAYKLNLRGPAITVQTACSTSLVAVHLACQSLLAGECDVAIAGAVTVQVPHRHGYLHQEGMILSPDGHCRAFDRLAQGTVGGSGAGAVVLRRLDAALRNGDCVRAVVRGSTVNNDGAFKAGYTAPSVGGQAAAISEALAVAGVRPSDISYLEAHGTGTPIGDPIEIAALRRVFGGRPARGPWCAIGSVKTNIGHLDTAAGIAGLIKTVLALEHRQLPASLHFEQPNPALELSETPFYVNTEPMAWSTTLPRRAGISSFGIGGTNAHVVVEQAPEIGSEPSTRSAHLLVLSAKTATALDSMAAALAAHLRTNPRLPLADVAFTLSTGRKTFPHRMAIVCADPVAASDALTATSSPHRRTAVNQGLARSVAFTFCGQGLQYHRLGAGLYASDAVFREQIDYCAAALEPHLGIDIRDAVFKAAAEQDGSVADLSQTALSQPMLFAWQYAMAKVWMHWGAEPRAMLGHSLGEYVAACLSGVFSLDDALALVAERGRLMQRLPPGAMLSVQRVAEDIRPLLPENVEVAAINAPQSCVVSGPVDEIEWLRGGLDRRGVDYQMLRTSHAFHSSMMDPIVRPFAERVARITLQPPRIPFVSNLTGEWIRPEQAQDPEYWAQHLRRTVLYVDGVRCLLSTEAAVLVEVGPSQGLEALCRLLPGGRDRCVVQSVRHRRNPSADPEFLLEAVARLWLAGGAVNWPRLYGPERRTRVPLPTYPFERQRHWIEPPGPAATTSHLSSRAAASTVTAEPARLPDPTDWFYVPSWKRSLPPRIDRDPPGPWLLFMDQCGIGAAIAARLASDQRRLIEVGSGSGFARVGERRFIIDPRRRGDYDALFEQLGRNDSLPATILHLWGVAGDAVPELSIRLDAAQDLGFFSVLWIAQALAVQRTAAAIRLFVVTNSLHHVAGEGRLCPEKATVLGAVTVVPRESANIRARSLDVVLPPPGSRPEAQLIDQVICEVSSNSADPIVAFRDGDRWVPELEPVRLERREAAPAPEGPTRIEPGVIRFRPRGAYLITGGIGAIGLTLAEHLATTHRARLVLTCRRSFPVPEDWDLWTTRNPDDEVSGVIRTLRRIEALGSEVTVTSADVTDLVRMREVCRSAVERFGSLDGVIHAAGVPGGGVIELKTREAAEQVLAPKVRGAVVLAELAREFRFDFLLFCSSLTSVVPEIGQADYVAANAFLDAYVPSLRQEGIPAVGVNWDTWQRIGMAVRTEVPPDLARAREWELLQGITPEDGPDLLQRIATSGLSRVVISTRPMDLRLRHRADAQARPAAVASAPRSALHPRPLATPYAEPGSDVQRRIAEDWQELLGIAPVGIFDSFFELGGHSLLAIQLMSRLAAACGVQLTLTSFFENPTIAGIAALVEERLSIASSAPGDPGRTTQSCPAETAANLAPLAQPRGDDASIPLSFSQQQLWLADQVEPGTSRYNEFGIHEIDGPLDAAALQRSVDALAQRHEALRTTVQVRDGSPVQRISASTSLPIRHVDLCSLAEDERPAAAMRVADQEATTPFDLSRGPLLRIVLIRLGDERHWLTLTIHHIIFDGWSGAVFIRDLLRLYDASASGTDPQLPELPIQYADFSLWQHQWMDENRRSRQRAYWQQQLAGAHGSLSLPYDHRPTVPAPLEGRRVNFALDEEVTRGVNALGQHAGATVFTTLLAAYAVLLHRYTRQDDLLIGAPVANRKWAVTEQVIGYFVNILPLRIDLSGRPTFVDLLTRIQRTVLEAQEHSDISLAELVPASRSMQAVRGPSPFPVLFVFRNATTAALPVVRGVRLRELDYEAVPMRSQLDLYVFETDRRLTGYCVYPLAGFERVSIERMLRRLTTLVRQVVDRPDVSIAELLHEKPPSLAGWRSRGVGPSHAQPPPGAVGASQPVASEESE